MSGETPGQAGGPFTMAEFDTEVRRRWIESSQRLGLDSGMPNAEAAIAAQQPQPAPELAAATAHIVTDPDAHRRHRCPTCLADDVKPAPELAAAKTPYGIAMEALEEILELDVDEGSFDAARAIASLAHSRAIAHWNRPAAPKPLRELAAAVATRDEYLGELTQVRMRVGRVAAALDSDALATQPSKKSQIQADAARRIREALA